MTLSNICFSANGMFTGVITEILAGPGHENIIYLSVSGGPVNNSCTTDTRYAFQLDTTNPGSGTWVSMILAAYTAGKTVYIQGTGSCTNNVENINQIRLM